MMRLLAGLLYVAFVLDAGNAQRGVLRRRAVDLEQVSKINVIPS